MNPEVSLQGPWYFHNTWFLPWLVGVTEELKEAVFCGKRTWGVYGLSRLGICHAGLLNCIAWPYREAPHLRLILWGKWRKATHMRQAEATFSELLWQESRHRHLRVAGTDMQVSGGWGVGKLQDGKNGSQWRLLWGLEAAVQKWGVLCDWLGAYLAFSEWS